MTSERIDPALILAQRAAGWPDFHPEDYCHRCGVRNPRWFTDRETWLDATSAWAAQTGREGICCPLCLAEMHAEANGREIIWRFEPWKSLRTLAHNLAIGAWLCAAWKDGYHSAALLHSVGVFEYWRPGCGKQAP